MPAATRVSQSGVIASGSSRGQAFGPFGFLWRRRGLLWRVTLTELRARYAGSALGLAWTVLFPLLFLGVYAAVFTVIFQVKYERLDGAEAVVLIFCGLIPFLSFAEALGSGTPSVSANSGLVKNTLFPIELVPVRTVLASQGTQVAGTAMLLIAVIAVGRMGWSALFVPVVWAAQVMFTIGIVWIFSAINVFARDLQHTIAVINLLLMLVSPIAWTEDMLPDRLRPIAGLNPLYYVIVGYQNALIEGRVPPMHVLIGLVIVGPGVMLLGWFVFRRLKLVFADHV
ncbi:MAG: ABC transporter permease [Planctomycetota bacterium]